MPLITPGNVDEVIPYRNESSFVSSNVDWIDKVRKFDEAGTWKCPKCGCIVHNWTKVCPYNRGSFICRTPQPK